MIDLSIIIVNYNSREFLEGCVESVYRETTAADFAKRRRVNAKSIGDWYAISESSHQGNGQHQ